MNMPLSPTLFCKHCRHYTPEGRRGGQCQLLSVAVQGNWQGCALSKPPFQSHQSQWDEIETVLVWQQPRPERVNTSEPTVASGVSGSNVGTGFDSDGSIATVLSSSQTVASNRLAVEAIHS